ncbi:S8 family serine peptidase [Xenorhabdus sp. SGI246]|uniref:S8 family serine peptidase n=1 Tax=Xenorhabdus sp. SGI246 TaxID=3158263 RepID=UPI00349F1A1B
MSSYREILCTGKKVEQYFDRDGHGTSMAGIAKFGDLSLILGSPNLVKIKHRIESIKLLRYPGDNEGKHLGQLTADGIR